ncbi:MAG TPA: hypothetical protein DIU00_17220 [Phycisphaerales bacterium]|nr:hypothetical protein [Phycisphaerales bacterium]
MNDNGIIPKKRRKLRFSQVLIILFLAGAGFFACYRLSLKSRLRARIDAIAAAGYPVTCAELDKWYSIPENAENAAYTIIDAISYYKLWDKDKSESLPVVGPAKLPARTEPMNEEMKALLTQYIADNNETLELLHEGAAIEHSRYPIDLSAGFETKLPPLSEIRRAVFLLKLEAILHAENGDGESAVRSAKSSFGIARSLAKEPIVVSQLVRVACQSLAATTIEYCINRIELKDEQLVELIECVHNAERISDISCAFVGERCNGISFFKAPGSVNPDIFNGIPVRPILELYKTLGLVDSDAIIYLDLMEEYIKSGQLPLHKRHRAAKTIEAKRKSTSQAHILLHIIVPAFSTITTIEIRKFASLRTARTALSIERYRLAAGKLPDALTDLVPAYLDAVPTDPFDGNELRYKKLEPGFVVYSIGEDMSDDGGKEKPPRKTKESPNWDVTFTVER